MTNEEQTKQLANDLASLKKVRTQQKYNRFVDSEHGSQINRVATEMGLSEDFIKEFTYNPSDKNALVGLIMSRVKGADILEGVATEAKKALDRETSE